MAENTPGPIFIFASGQRCGSTLLQRFLCSHPDILIWGEHDGVLRKMFSQFDRLYEWRDMFGHQTDNFLTDGYNNFIPNMNPSKDVIRAAQIQLLKNLWETPSHRLGKSIWGFKEVLYGADIAFALRELFPCTRIIHLTRNIFECFISLRHEEQIMPEMQPHVPVKQVWTRSRTIEFINLWVEVNQSLLETPGLTDDWIYHITYEELIGNPHTTTSQLAKWLGTDITRFDMDVFKYKLYTDRHKGPDPRPIIKRSDLSEDEVALVMTDEILRLSKLLNFDMTV